MRIVVLGLGVQGHKRRKVAGSATVATVDPVNRDADFRELSAVPLDSFDAALVCTPDGAKIALLEYLLEHGKHVLVEKPLLSPDSTSLERLRSLATANNAVCYTAYNHRFEPHFARMKRVLDSGELGEIYSVRMFYGNGTARLVRESAWRDSGDGVLPDLGSHLLDTILFWFGEPVEAFRAISANRFENRSLDHVTFGANTRPLLQMEITLLSWRNHFYADIYAERGSAHIQSLCKWGPSSFVQRNRKLPSGRPEETCVTLTQSDPTWELEFEHFCRLCQDPAAAGYGNLENDIWISGVLADLSRQIGSAPLPSPESSPA